MMNDNLAAPTPINKGNGMSYRRIRNRCLFICTLAILLLLAGCATTPNIFTNTDPSADFSTYHTYGFDPQLSTDRAGYGSLLSQYLKTAVTREMESRGYRTAENPDLVVNFFVNTQEKIRTRTTPTAGGYYGYRGYDTWGGYGMGYGGSETTVTQFTEGTLTVDMVDNAKRQLVWEANLVGRITKKVRENLEPTINQAVMEIFAQYPHAAGVANVTTEETQ
jgi:hypothetical protein